MTAVWACARLLAFFCAPAASRAASVVAGLSMMELKVYASASQSSWLRFASESIVLTWMAV